MINSLKIPKQIPILTLRKNINCSRTLKKEANLMKIAKKMSTGDLNQPLSSTPTALGNHGPR